LNPLDAGDVKDFDAWFYIIAAIGAWYCSLSYLGSQASNASAKTAHEYRMGVALSVWRWMALCVFFMVLVLISYAYLHHPAYAEEAVGINAVLDTISPDADNAVRAQQTVTVALARILPSGLKGLMAVVMLAAIITTYNTFLHTWGSVLIQDVIMPFRKTPLSTEQHMKWLRLSLVGVGVFIFLFSCFFPQRQSILMYFALVNNIWFGASGAVIIGGLYWKKGTTAGALTALVLGAAMSVVAIVCVQVWPEVYDREFPVNGQWVFLITIASTSVVYVAVSLVGSTKRSFDLDRLLHRGQYAIEDDQTHVREKTRFYMRLFGITSEFTRFDRFTAYVVFGWTIALVAMFFLGTIYATVFDTSDDAWATFWYFYLWHLFVVFVISTIWLTVGGLRDIRKMFKVLSSSQRDYSDDGTVSHEETDCE